MNKRQKKKIAFNIANDEYLYRKAKRNCNRFKMKWLLDNPFKKPKRSLKRHGKKR